VTRSLRAWCVLLSSLAAVSIARAGTPSTIHSLPFTFEANDGQASAQYTYVFHRDRLRAFFFRNGVDFDVAEDGGAHGKVRLTFVGGGADPKAHGVLKGHTNYLIGKDASAWIRNVPLSKEIAYEGIYPGISLSFYGNGRELEHDFRAEAGADVSRIAMRLDGADAVEMSPDGDLEIHAGGNVLTMRKPVAYQEGEHGRDAVDAKFDLAKDGTVRFALGKYDATQPLVVDPVFVFSTYLGGTGMDVPSAVATDASGNIYVTGYTASTDFPTSHAEQPAMGGCDPYAGCQNVFVTKLDPTGTTLIYSTYLGGSSRDHAGAIAVDATGDAIVAGIATSSDFPHAGAIVQPACPINAGCYFIASLAPDGSTLKYSGMIGGPEGSYTNGVDGRIAVDGSGNAYLAGVTGSSDFQVTSGVLSATFPGYPENVMFVMKVDPTGRLVYSTYVPGNAPNDPTDSYINFFLPTGIVVDGSGNVTTAGMAGLGLPTTPGVVAAQFPNAYVNVSSPSAGFVLQLNASATAINFASYLPGTDFCEGMTVDGTGNYWIVGNTSEATLPVSANAYQKVPAVGSLGNVSSGFILELAPQATAVLGATYLDGSGANQTQVSSGFSSVAIDSQANVFVGGMTSAPDFPMQDPFVTEYETASTVSALILAEMSPDLSTLEFGSYLSSVDSSYGGSQFAGLALDGSNRLIVAGATYSRNYPTTAGSFEPQLPLQASPYSTPAHVFVTKIDMSTPTPAVCPDAFSLDFGNVNYGNSASRTLNVKNCGNAVLNLSGVNSSDPTVVVAESCGAIAPGAVCAVTLTFTPVASQSVTGTATLVDNATTIPQTVSFTGEGIAPKISATPMPLVFGHAVVGQPAVAGTVIVSNQGDLSLAVGAVTVTGVGYSLLSNSCTQPMSLDVRCVLQVAFAPTATGAQRGSLVIASNDPAAPTLTVPLSGVGDSVFAAPSVSSIGAGTIQINSGPETLQITGSNFYPQSIVQVNGVAQTTVYQDNNDLQVTIAASSLTKIGELPLTVVNPGPGGGTSAPVVVTPYQTLPIDPSALASSPTTGLVYAAIPAAAPNNPNTVIPLDPTTGVQGTPIAVGNDPRFLAVSSDGSYLYVANQGDLTLQRINLATNSVERTFPFTPNIYCPSCETLIASDLAGVPGAPREVLLAQGSILSLFDDAGLVNYVPDSSCCHGDPTFNSIALAGNPLTIYGLPFSFGGNYFQTVNLTASGLQYTRPSGSTSGGSTSTGPTVVSDGKLLYTSAGQVWDPSSQTMVGTFPAEIYNATSYPNLHSLTLDTSLGKIFSMGQQTYQTYSVAFVISAYGMKSLALAGALTFPQIVDPEYASLVRWGTNGLAFIDAGPGLTDQEVYLVSSSIANPAEANPAPALTSFTPDTANAGGGAFTLTVNGSSFIPSSLVEWNGTALATTYVSATQLTAAVPASALANPGTAGVSVVTPGPGGGTTAILPFTIAAVTPPSNPAPVLTSMSPTTANAGGAAFTLTVNGSSFISSSLVEWNGRALTTTYVSATQLTAAVPASAIANAGNAQVAVNTPGPGGGMSATLQFTIAAATTPSNPTPAITGLAPAIARAGAADFTLTVAGSGFVQGSTVYWGSTALTTQFVSATQLTAQVAAAQVSSAGVVAISVQSPAPGGGTSNALQMEVDSAGGGVSAPVFGETQATVAPGGSASYGVTLPSTATNVSVKCLNLPQGATCSYAGGTVTIATSTSTPGGTYAITVVFTETLPLAAGAVVLPFLLMPLVRARRRSAKGVWLMVLAGTALTIGAVIVGCGGGNSGGISGGGGNGGGGGSSTQTVTSSGTVTLTVQ
jgi:Abnormal spindle-like microcephaly-assoc'd, ASPM-SPD-2-Hydin/Beta-propeller repeat